MFFPWGLGLLGTLGKFLGACGALAEYSRGSGQTPVTYDNLQEISSPSLGAPSDSLRLLQDFWKGPGVVVVSRVTSTLQVI